MVWTLGSVVQTKGAVMKSTISKFLADQSGATAIEYGLIAAIIGVGLIAALTGLKNNLSGKFNEIGSSLNS